LIKCLSNGTKISRLYTNKMFLIDHSLEIMQLAFGLGFLVLVFFIICPLIRIHRLLAKIDYLADKMGVLTELFDEYIRKPAQVASQILKFVTPLLFRKK
jgi:hypothetical protein